MTCLGSAKTVTLWGFYSGLPNRDDVGEEHYEAKQVAKPRPDEALQSHHDDREHQLGQEQGLGQTIQLQVQ